MMNFTKNGMNSNELHQLYNSPHLTEEEKLEYARKADTDEQYLLLARNSDDGWEIPEVRERVLEGFERAKAKGMLPRQDVSLQRSLTREMLTL